jgi:uncharacterized membrane protein YczE
MSARTLHRFSWVMIALVAIAIGYVTLAPEPPHWGTLIPGPDAAQTGVPPQFAPPPGWTAAAEEAVGHALLFGLLGAVVALWYATSAAARRAPQRTLVMTLLALWLFGGLTEMAQELTDTRSAQLSDLFFDVVGALIGFLGGAVVWRFVLTRLGVRAAGRDVAPVEEPREPRPTGARRRR